MTGSGRWVLFGVIALAAAGCVGLGFWQWGRLLERRAANRAALAGRALPGLDLNLVEPSLLANQRLGRAAGVFDHANAIVLRGRLERDAPGVQVVVPLRLTGRGEAVLVNRGFVPAADAATFDPAAVDTTAVMSVEGVLLAVPNEGDGQPITRNGRTTWRRLDLAALRTHLPYPILDVYLHETARELRPAGAPPWPLPAALPALDDGPHLSYMVQWFGIAAAALAFGVVFVLRGGGATRGEPG